MPTATAERATRTVAGARHGAGAAAVRLVPSASFTAFRVAFGVLVAYSSARFLVRGWVERFYLAPAHHLTYAGFEWVRPLPAPLMYTVVVALTALGVAIAVGYRYRAAAAVFAIGFAYADLIDAALYLNHHWFVVLAAVLLAVLPAPRGGMVPAVNVWALRAQLAAVYVFAGIAKLNPDWLFDGQPMRIWLAARSDRPLIGGWLDDTPIAFALSWAGALFDLTIVGWLLWRRSRPYAYSVVVAFHLATAMLFQIGVFPWVMIALTPIFFPPDWPRRLWGRLSGRRPIAVDSGARPTVAPVRAPTLAVLAALAIVNLVLPLRHYAAKGNVRFNDDGYYLSWRVMLTERTGFVEYTVTEPDTGQSWSVRPDAVLTEWQAAQATRRPDLVLATAHIVAADFHRRGHHDVEVRANAWVSINGRARQRWIDPDIDLAATSRHAAAADYVLPISS